MEFKKRYKQKVTISGNNRLPGNMAGRISQDSRAELVLCVDSKGDCIGCAGVEGELFILLREKEDELYECLFYVIIGHLWNFTH